MRLKTYYLILACLALMGVKASAQVVTINPAKFTAEDEITIRVDLTGTSMANTDPVYIWSWSNIGDSHNGGNWGNSLEIHKLTKVSTSVWEIKMVPAIFFNATPADLKVINFLFKSKTGSSQTRNFEGYKCDPLTFSETQFRSFPSKAMQDDVITIYHTNSLAPTEAVQRMTTVTSVTLTAFDVADAQIGTAVTRNVDSYVGGVATCGIIPSKVFTVPANKKIAKIKAVFKGKGLDANGNAIDVDSNEGEIILLDLQ